MMGGVLYRFFPFTPPPVSQTPPSTDLPLVASAGGILYFKEVFTVVDEFGSHVFTPKPFRSLSFLSGKTFIPKLFWLLIGYPDFPSGCCPSS